MFKGKVTFVGGAMRTGTSLLQSVLCGAKESNDMSYECMYLRDQLNLYANWIIREERSLTDYFDGHDGLKAYTKSMIHDLVSMSHQQQLKPEHLILKSPEITMNFHLLMDLMPEAKYVVAVRDPKDIVASMIEVARKQTENSRQSNMTNAGRDMQKLSAIFQYYYHNLVKSREQHKGRVYFVQYEQLVSDYVTVVPRLSAFTGLDLSNYDPEAEWKYTRPRSSNEMFDTEARGKRITKSNIGNYKNILSSQEASAVEKHSWLRHRCGG